MLDCSIPGCPGSRYEYTKMYTFPKDLEIAKIWAFRCGRVDLQKLKSARICARHFSQKHKRVYRGKLFKPPTNFRDIREDAIPDLNINITTCK